MIKIPKSEKANEILLCDEETEAFACYYVIGGSEGYYAHIQRVCGDGYFRFGNISKEGLCGKFWEKERAEQAVKIAQRLLNQVVM